MAETRASRERLRADLEARLYDAPDDAAWFRNRYAAPGRELAAWEAEPKRLPGMIRRPTGEIVADRWFGAPDVQARQEILVGFGVRVTLFPVGAPRRWVPGFVHGPERNPTSTLWVAMHAWVFVRGGNTLTRNFHRFPTTPHSTASHPSAE
ncbi:hypothetical protein [Streptomyces sp. DW26H14]|uniref:hypothetical protein n=1 Tax=Streptomyces sp. DW26H14 TaxID=3435395 RepID=UPI00403DA3AC